MIRGYFLKFYFRGGRDDLMSPMRKNAYGNLRVMALVRLNDDGYTDDKTGLLFILFAGFLL